MILADFVSSVQFLPVHKNRWSAVAFHRLDKFLRSVHDDVFESRCT